MRRPPPGQIRSGGRLGETLATVTGRPFGGAVRIRSGRQRSPNMRRDRRRATGASAGHGRHPRKHGRVSIPDGGEPGSDRPRRRQRNWLSLLPRRL